MRPAKHLKIIATSVELLTDFKTQVENLTQHIENVMKQAELWIDGTQNDYTFEEIHQFLRNETNNCIQQCFCIASENQELLDRNVKSDQITNGINMSFSSVSLPSKKDDMDYHKILAKLEDLQANVSSLKKTSAANEENLVTLNQSYTSLSSLTKSHSKKLKSLKQQVNQQKVQIDSFTAKHEADLNNNKLKFSDIMKELQAASDYIQEKTDSFSSKVSEVEEKLETISQVVNPLNQNFEDVSSLITKNIVLIEPMVKAHSQNTEAFEQKINALDTKIQDISSKVHAFSQMTDNKNKLMDGNMLPESSDSSENSLKNISTEDILPIKYINHPATNSSQVTTALQLKVDSLDNQIQEMTSYLKILSEQNGKLSIPTAFNARVKDEKIELNLIKNQVLTCFNGVIYNIGKNYNPDTGIFMAPCDGFYLCGVFIDANVDADLQFGIKRKAKSNGKEFLLATTHTRAKEAMVCDVGAVDLYKEDELFVTAHNDFEKVKLSTYSHFLCILLSKY